MKRCSKCLEEKPLNEFNKKGDGKQPWCKVCNAKRSRQYYAENRDKHLATIKERSRTSLLHSQQAMCEYLSRHPCVDCGETDILVLEFDHLRDKVKNVANLMTHGWNRVLQEIEKCEVVCANCHRRRTMIKGNHYRARYRG